MPTWQSARELLRSGCPTSHKAPAPNELRTSPVLPAAPTGCSLHGPRYHAYRVSTPKDLISAAVSRWRNRAVLDGAQGRPLCAAADALTSSRLYARPARRPGHLVVLGEEPAMFGLSCRFSPHFSPRAVEVGTLSGDDSRSSALYIRSPVLCAAGRAVSRAGTLPLRLAGSAPHRPGSRLYLAGRWWWVSPPTPHGPGRCRMLPFSLLHRGTSVRSTGSPDQEFTAVEVLMSSCCWAVSLCSQTMSSAPALRGALGPPPVTKTGCSRIDGEPYPRSTSFSAPSRQPTARPSQTQ